MEDYASDALNLCPSETQDVHLPVYLPQHLPRITGVATYDEIETTLESLHNTHVVHSPTLMISVGSVQLFSGGVWAQNNVFISRKLKREDIFNRIDIPQAVITDSDIGSGFFGHWLRDVTTSSLVASKETPSISMVKPPFFHAKEYAQLFKLKTIYANRGHVDNLYLLSDDSQNSYKRKRYLQLRSNLENSLKPESIAYKGVFIARGQSGKNRPLLNEDEVIVYLLNNGFDVIYPEDMQASDIIRRLWGVKMVITVEGSAHNHAIYSMNLTGALLHLQPPQRFGEVFRGVCNCLGIAWGFYVCQAATEGHGFYLDSFPDLERVMNQLFEQIA